MVRCKSGRMHVQGARTAQSDVIAKNGRRADVWISPIARNKNQIIQVMATNSETFQLIARSRWLHYSFSLSL